MFSYRQITRILQTRPYGALGHMVKGETLTRASRAALATLVAAMFLGVFAASPAAAAPLLRSGSHGAAVTKAQRLLHIRADGVFGRMTAGAVRRFQRSHHLHVDGAVGPATWRALLHRSAARSGSSRSRSDGILRLGLKGDRVAEVQRRLHIRVNRLFDRRTYLAVRGFQRRHRLLVDGEVGPRTWAALHRVQTRSGGHARRSGGNGVLGLGQKSDRVAAVQRLLDIRVNRLYDRRTYLAVRAFQRRRALLIDGQVGPQTWAALHRHPSRPAGGSTLAARALSIARSYAGVRYVWGGASPRGFDCSGLIWYAYRRLGVTIPRVTYGQWNAGRHVRFADLRPGDLVFFNHHSHVGLWIGHGWFLHAPWTGQVVHASRFLSWYRSHYDGAVRIG
jgi:peptidoglycan hydrolase-like protein with peptidoglycan-binding domain